jgi:hypothetical protein
VDSSFFLSLSFSFFDILAYSYRPSVQTISNSVKRVLTDRIGITGWTVLQMYPFLVHVTRWMVDVYFSEIKIVI